MIWLADAVLVVHALIALFIVGGLLSTGFCAMPRRAPHLGAVSDID